MYRLTDKRLQKAKPILDEYMSRLQAAGKIDVMEFEVALRNCWRKIGYQELKGIFKDMAGRREYLYLAAYYMEHSNEGRVVVEFQGFLASLYGVKWYRHNSPEINSKRKAFWEKMKQ